jgi:hypothetical protein
MNSTGPQIITELRDKLQFDIGRHLYSILGTYHQLEAFEQDDLRQAMLPGGAPFPCPVNLNRQLLANISDEDLRKLVRDEARRPLAVKRALNIALDTLLGSMLSEAKFLILKSVELVFAYDLELSLFRTRAANQNHILLLLPGQRRSDHVTIFHEASTRFHRTLPTNLIADNHLWELIDG